MIALIRVGMIWILALAMKCIFKIKSCSSAKGHFEFKSFNDIGIERSFDKMSGSMNHDDSINNPQPNIK